MKHANLIKWLIIFFLFVLGSLAVVEKINRLERQELWGYLPLGLFIGYWIAISLILFPNPLKNKKSAFAFIGPLLGGLALAFSFPPSPFPLFAMAGFIPILLLSDRQLNFGYSRKMRLLMAFHTFMTWNIVATFWVANTALAAGIFAIVVNSLLMLIPWTLFLWTRHRIGFFKAGVIFASYWLTFEFLHHNWELTWPWLTLGNALSGLPILAQWYEFTGSPGGSLWIIGGNWWLYLAAKRSMMGYPRAAKNYIYFRFLPWLIIPSLLSIYIYSKPDTEAEKIIKVAVVQPNFEPHYEKFRIPYSMQLQRISEQIEYALEAGAEIVVLPETSVRVNLHEGKSDGTLRSLTRLMEKYPDAHLIAGLNSLYIFENREQADEAFLRIHIRAPGDTIFWESHNSAGVINRHGLQEIYFKSKLVPGAEIFPFRNLLFFMEPLVDQLGGSTSGLRTQEERSAFLTENIGLAPVICYESVFGEFHRGYFEAGARGILIMTNDGWWDNSPGHIQHLYIGALRAIEYRKEIARSANTGISGFIDEKGRVRYPTLYEETAVVIDELRLNSRQTFYARNGDILSRIAGLLSLGFLLLLPANKLKSKLL